MKNHTLSPLTEKEKKFAEQNHGLVYDFLHKRGYSIEEYYNVVIPGFLKAIQIYHRREDIRDKYAFPFISQQYMRAEIKDYFRIQDAKKRKPVEMAISLDADCSDEAFYKFTGRKSAEADVLEKILYDTVLRGLSESRRKIVLLKVNGYNDKEVYSMMGIPSSTYYKEMQKIRAIVKELMFD
ncbi:MAG: hypothetical protein LBS02_17565 [Hungatella sp.]|nr:hypothetical protein [Hungatella sp.]